VLRKSCAASTFRAPAAAPMVVSASAKLCSSRRKRVHGDEMPLADKAASMLRMPVSPSGGDLGGECLSVMVFVLPSLSRVHGISRGSFARDQLAKQLCLM